MMKTVASIRKWMDKIIMGACIVLFGLMVIVGSYQIITRYFFNKPSTVSEELLTFSFVWMALLASAYVFGIRDHMRMGFLADKIQGKGRIVLDIVIEILILVFALLTLVWGGSAIMQLSMQQMTASLGVPMGYIYTILPVSG
ncbi:TRAP transporter small permease, partial [Dubosiella newyorkensis]